MADSGYYDILGLQRTSTSSEVKDAYRKLSLKWHPDKHNEKSLKLAEQKFRQIAEAYTVLSDLRLRARYDQYGMGGLSGSNAGTAGESTWSFQEDPHAVFTAFHGTTSSFAAALATDALLRDPREEKQAQCPPIDVNLYLSLEELARGASVKVKVTRSALQADLKTTAPEDRVLTVTVAPGWRAGTKLTFPGAGDEAAGLKAGDVILTVLEKPHPRFTRVKHDLVHTVTLSLLKALAGTVVEVEVLDGRVISVPVNEVVAPGYVQVVPGEGMPVSGKPDKKGNLQLHFNVVYPSSLSIAQKEKLALILPQ